MRDVTVLGFFTLVARTFDAHVYDVASAARSVVVGASILEADRSRLLCTISMYVCFGL